MSFFNDHSNAPPEARQIREDLERARREAPTQRYLVARKFNAGWAHADAGESIDLTDAQAKMLAPWLGDVIKESPKARAAAAPESNDPPGAPPIPEGPPVLNTALSSTAPAGGKGRKKGR